MGLDRLVLLLITIDHLFCLMVVGITFKSVFQRMDEKLNFRRCQCNRLTHQTTIIMSKAGPFHIRPYPLENSGSRPLSHR
ncbi:hypothetical protein LZ31DRAFT_113944 [Colletotrichum somersetense]|nr:hypothetical protein LZ31DRAFT_113944 [Colletotrichum somersetense]